MMSAHVPKRYSDVADDEGAGDVGGLDIANLHVQSLANAAGVAGKYGTSPVGHDWIRSHFANGPAARDAAAILQRALGMSDSAAIMASLDPHAVQRIEYRFKNRQNAP